MLRVSQLYIYPVKSLAGIPITSARVTDRGLEHDRRWLLIDPAGVQITQREIPAMALLRPALTPEGLLVTHMPTNHRVLIPFTPTTNQYREVQCWDDTVTAQFVHPEADAWFSETLNTHCRLVYMPDTTHRQTDLNYTDPGHYTSFADGYPFLLIGEASLDELNSRLEHPLPMNRFRPNIVFSGGTPFEEDELSDFTIGDVQFQGVKRCARCVMTTIDQETAEQGKEPLRTLSRYRAKGHKILFGQNLIHNGRGSIAVGDELKKHYP